MGTCRSVAEPLGAEHRHNEVDECEHGKDGAEPDHDGVPPNRSQAIVRPASKPNRTRPRISIRSHTSHLQYRSIGLILRPVAHAGIQTRGMSIKAASRSSLLISKLQTGDQHARDRSHYRHCQQCRGFDFGEFQLAVTGVNQSDIRRFQRGVGWGQNDQLRPTANTTSSESPSFRSSSAPLSIR